MKLTNDAQGRDVIRLRTRQPVPRTGFAVTIRKASSPLIYYVGNWRTNTQGRKKAAPSGPKPSKSTCYQIQIVNNKVNSPPN